MLLIQYAIKWWFVIPPLLTSVSRNTNPKIVSFQLCCIPCLKNEMARREIIFAHCDLIAYKNYWNWFMSVDDLARQTSVIFDTRYTAWLKLTLSCEIVEKTWFGAQIFRGKGCPRFRTGIFKLHLLLTIWALCGLWGCKNRAHSVCWLEVIKGVPNQDIHCVRKKSNPLNNVR